MSKRKEIEIESGGGFKPKEFKSSRSKPYSEKKQAKDEHENAMFGSISNQVGKLLENKEGLSASSKQIESGREIMHENVK